MTKLIVLSHIIYSMNMIICDSNHSVGDITINGDRVAKSGYQNSDLNQNVDLILRKNKYDQI